MGEAYLMDTSKSMLMNIPIAILLVSGLRILFNEVELRWKVRNNIPTSYLSHLQKKQLYVNDSRLNNLPPPPKWKRKIDSPVVEAAIEDFINKLLHDFVIDLWYSDITPDKEAPELIHAIVMDVLGEVSARVKELNLVDLLTRDVVDLVGNHLDLFRRNQAAIGMDVMGTLSFDERDERLKHHLIASKELHPALISPECSSATRGWTFSCCVENKGGPMPFSSMHSSRTPNLFGNATYYEFRKPRKYINELIEYIIFSYNNEGFKDATDQSPNVGGHNRQKTASGEHGQSSESDLRKSTPSINQRSNLPLSHLNNKRKLESGSSGDLLTSTMPDGSTETGHAEWAKVFEAATQRRTEVLMPENLENMWTIGRNYKKKLQNEAVPGCHASEINGSFAPKDLVAEVAQRRPETYIRIEDNLSMQLPPRPQQDTRPTDLSTDDLSSSQELKKELFRKESSSFHELDNPAAVVSRENKDKLKRSNSTSDLKIQPNLEDLLVSKGSAPIFNEYYSADMNKLNVHGLTSSSDMVLQREGHAPKLRCRVVGAYFEKLGSKSFAVYSIAVADADNTTRFVKRRYRNFERLHRHLKDIPNYTLHLPPKRIFSSSTEDAFVHQRCIQLDKYLQDLLSIANVAEQHEVWDFLSASSKNYSFGKSPSVMRTLAVNVDDAVDDIVRQFKGVSDGFMWKVGVSPSSSFEQTSSVTNTHLSWNADDINKLAMRQTNSESVNSFSDNDDADKDVIHGEQLDAVTQASGWCSEYESNSKGFPQRVVKRDEDVNNLDSEEMCSLRLKSELISVGRYPEHSLGFSYVPQEDPTGVPPEWTPPNLSVPVLNLVDNVFQLKRRGWLRRQVFWISKQILQLVMEDAIDDWLFRQIQWLRRGDVIAQGIRWVQDILWPDGTFFLRLRAQNQTNDCEGSQQSTRQPGGTVATRPGSFEQQLEAARRASDVKKMIFNGAPTTLVSLIGQKQYRRCARDIYYFLQSTVCLKQLGYGILELVLISIFPELHDLVKDIHEKMRTEPMQS
ncbi:hypothetical protein OROGR_031550 [Orobanche gracilis]